jgi:hypothetical protein
MRRASLLVNGFPRLRTLVTERNSARAFRSDVDVDEFLSAAASGDIEDENDTYASGVELVLENVGFDRDGVLGQEHLFKVANGTSAISSVLNTSPLSSVDKRRHNLD